MTVLLIFAAVLFFGTVLAITLPYWYELGNSPCEDIPASPYGFKSVIKLWVQASWAALLLGLALGLDPLMRYCEKKDQDAGNEELPPLLLVHGLYHNATGWLYLRRRLRKAGFRKICTMSYSSWRTDMEIITRLLDCEVKNLEHQYPGQKPILVGHSLGGLLIRNWLAKEENQGRVLGALTLGAPHKGSKMAAVAFGALGKSLLPSNPFFENLARTESPASIPCVSLVSEADTMVLPIGNLVPVTRGWVMRVTPYATHAGILTRGAVMRMAAWELHRMARETATATQPVSAPEEQPSMDILPADPVTEPESFTTLAATEDNSSAPPASAPEKESSMETPEPAPATETEGADISVPTIAAPETDAVPAPEEEPSGETAETVPADAVPEATDDSVSDTVAAPVESDGLLAVRYDRDERNQGGRAKNKKKRR